jgi:hypothetical protein
MAELNITFEKYVEDFRIFLVFHGWTVKQAYDFDKKHIVKYFEENQDFEYIYNNLFRLKPYIYSLSPVINKQSRSMTNEELRKELESRGFWLRSWGTEKLDYCLMVSVDPPSEPIYFNYDPNWFKVIRASCRSF